MAILVAARACDRRRAAWDRGGAEELDAEPSGAEVVVLDESCGWSFQVIGLKRRWPPLSEVSHQRIRRMSLLPLRERAERALEIELVHLPVTEDGVSPEEAVRPRTRAEAAPGCPRRAAAGFVSPGCGSALS